MRIVSTAIVSSVLTASVLTVIASGQPTDERRTFDVNLMVRNHPLELKNDRLMVDVEGRVKQESVFAAFESQLGPGATIGLETNGVASHTAQIVVGGQPQVCVYRIEGSNDRGNHWFAISDRDISCVASTVAFIPNRPVQMIRGVLLALEGGTAGNVTLYYAGR